MYNYLLLACQHYLECIFFDFFEQSHNRHQQFYLRAGLLDRFLYMCLIYDIDEYALDWAYHQLQTHALIQSQRPCCKDTAL